MGNPQDEIEALEAEVRAFTRRSYKVEQMWGLVSEGQPQKPAAVPPAAPSMPPPSVSGASLSPTSRPPSLGTPAASKAGDANLEKKIGQYWLNRIGIVAILVGVSYFIKLAFDNNWIGPGGRIAIGLLAGIRLLLWSERLRNRGYKAFSYSLKAVGIGTLYLSLWGAFQVYHLIPSAAAFVAMVIVTAATIALALSQDAELLAGFALIGGFATPVLLSTGQNHEVWLFSYVGLLDVAILAMAAARPWRRLLWGSFAGTIILYAGWYGDYYSTHQPSLTAFFSALFAAIFAAIPLATRYERSTRFPGPSITLTLLPLLNAAAFFLALYAMYQRQTVTLPCYALTLAAVYLGIGKASKKRFPNQ